MNRLSLRDRTQVVSCLVEGNSLRSTARLTGASLNTVTSLLVDVGTACALYQNEVMRDLKCLRLQLDECWGFIGMKQRNVPPPRTHVLGYGDVWLWCAICADSKLVPSWMIGHRDAHYARMFVNDLAARLAKRPQITTDGNKTYLRAIDDAFGSEVDYSMLVKLYGEPEGGQHERRYSSGHCTGTITGTVSGDPDPAHVSTSFVERQNLSVRMSVRRMTRLTNAFSRKLFNHECAISLHYMAYNFYRIHRTLKTSPAQAAGVDDHLWSVEEITRLAD